jgi:hypothetical protein
VSSSHRRFALGLRLAMAASALLGSRAALAQSFGAALATGNFDRAGGTWASDDFAVGTPTDDWGATAAGSVTVYWQANTATPRIDYLDQSRLANYFTGAQDGGNELYDWFGAAIAVGDFDRDGYKDLAIGAPYENIGNTTDAGCVHVVYGAASGAGPGGMPFRTATKYLTRADAFNGPIPNVPGAGDRFGSALAAGDFDGDGYDDLAIGAPGTTVNGKTGAGAVFVFYSSVGVFSSTHEWTLIQGGLYSPSGVAEANDAFGSALAAGNFNGDFDAGTQIGTGPSGVPIIKDLAVGAPGQTVNSAGYAGNVTIYYGRAFNSFNRTNNYVIDQSMLETPEAFDGFGASLAAGDFDSYCPTANVRTCGIADDLAIGVPNEGFGGTPGAGLVHVLYGKPAGLGTAGSQKFWSNTIDANHPPENNARFGFSLAAGNAIKDPNGGCQGNSCDPVELVIGEPGWSRGDGAIFVLKGGTRVPLSANHQIKIMHSQYVGLNSNFGKAVAVGQIGQYPNSTANSFPAADILVGSPTVNDVRLRYGDETTLNGGPGAVRDFPWPW